MEKVLTSFIFAAMFNGMSWWGLFAQSEDATFGSVVQLVGTGGLVSCLVIGIVTLWREREAISKRFEKEVNELRILLAKERSEHRVEVGKLHSLHKTDLQELTNKLLSELSSQISELKQDTKDHYEPKQES